MAPLSQKEMTDALISAKKEDLVQTFKKFEKEQNHYILSFALANVAKAPKAHP